MKRFLEDQPFRRAGDKCVRSCGRAFGNRSSEKLRWLVEPSVDDAGLVATQMTCVGAHTHRESDVDYTFG
jgi:hypothetical protein